MSRIAEELKLHVRGDIADDPQTLATFSHDASLFEVRPELVVSPKDVTDVKELVRFVNAKNATGARLSLTARSAGTDMSGGPLTESIVVNCLPYLNHIKELGDGYAVTEPGVFYRDFERATMERNLLLPCYPASRELCTVGGMVANNSGGEKTLQYGKTEAYAEEIKMVLRDGEEHTFRRLTFAELEQKKREPSLEGEIYRALSALIDANAALLQAAKPRVSKNSCGYFLWNVVDRERQTFDILKLIVGSQGTFGLMTEIKFRLVTPKPHSRLLVIFLKDMAVLPQLINHVLGFKPESFESYDDHTFRVAMRYLPEILHRLVGHHLVRLGLSFLPELWETVTGGVPKLVLLAEFTAETEIEAVRRAREAHASIREFHVASRVLRSEAEAQKFWVIRRESFNLLREHVHGMRTAPFIDDLVVRPEDLPEFLPELYRILDQYNIIYTVAGHVGDANFHIIPLMNFRDPRTASIIVELSRKVYDLVFQFHGSMSGEHNDGLIRSPFLQDMYGEAVCALFKATKQIFDPGNIFNPGKKVGASLDYAVAHIVRQS